MQIVIDIPDDFYERVNKKGGMSVTDAEIVVNAFYCGKVLPKGHGRLIDYDALAAKAMLYAPREFDGLFIDVKDVRNAPTVIDADKEVDG